MLYDVAVVGGGPAGLSAAVQAQIRNKTVLLLSGDSRDSPLQKAERVDNYLGFPGCTGAELLAAFERHAAALSLPRQRGHVLTILPLGEKFLLSVGADMVEARAVILAPGVRYGAKYPGEEAYLGRGVSYCATCDGMLFRNKDVAVLGQSAEAPAEANYLHGLGCRVTYLAKTRPEHLRAEIPFVKAQQPEILGETHVRALRVGGETLAVDGVFVLRAATAPGDLLPGLALENGYVAVDRNMATNFPGVYAAGDCTGLPLQISKAIGEGQIAGHRAAEYLDLQEKFKK